MIRTNYKVSLSIDGEVFDLVIKEPNKSEKEALETKANESMLALNKLQSLNDELNLNESIIKTNDDLIRQNGSLDKTNLLLENKELLRKNAAIKKELLDLQNQSEISSSLERLFRLRSELLISGEDKERLFKTLDAKGVKYENLWQHLNSEILKENEKK
ncbi:hypothetical protein CE91St25_15250 [Campylobacter ureolyticus]|uniref:hypothetical protein n=1 Tax=Campylobacter ureolyticus TaxID=827 RepID=UPI001FC8772D|nr:hypothetical protein [Campylobacter ureolyticus]GKH61189.1 hypothetical protein CE91St25_15250 [Campylobacter ureolyticus]